MGVGKEENTEGERKKVKRKEREKGRGKKLR